MSKLTPEVLAIHQWIRDDAPVSMKMTITPKLIDALVERLEAARSGGDVSRGGAEEDKEPSQGCGSDHSGSRDEPTVGATAALASKPVAWRYRFLDRMDASLSEWDATTNRDAAFALAGPHGKVEPLYAAPPSALPDEVVRLTEALRDLRSHAVVLLQNSEGCAVNHYGEDFSLFGMPGWLADARAAVERATTALQPFADRLPTTEGA